MQRVTGMMMAGMMACWLCGCEPSEMFRSSSAEAAPESSPASSAYLEKTAIQDDSGSESPAAVDMALEWARKYSEVTTQRDELLAENRQLQQANQQHEQQLAEVAHRAERAEQELAEANAMLLEMRGELGQWKASVLGFRGEMLEAQKAQLEAMYKVMRLVGGEVVEPAAEQTAQAAPAADAADAQEDAGATQQ